jgi:hypothetical protein
LLPAGRFLLTAALHDRLEGVAQDEWRIRFETDQRAEFDRRAVDVALGEHGFSLDPIGLDRREVRINLRDTALGDLRIEQLTRPPRRRQRLVHHFDRSACREQLSRLLTDGEGEHPLAIANRVLRGFRVLPRGVDTRWTPEQVERPLDREE